MDIRVLLVDDDAQLRKVMRRILEKAGYVVAEAADGVECLALCRASQPHAVILDLIMPKKEGLETIMEMKRAFPKVPIVAVSGGGRNNAGVYLEMASKFGAKYAFEKPVDREALLEALRELTGPGPA